MPQYSQALLDQITSVTTATLTTVMFKKGVVNTWIRGAAPLAEGAPRVAGPAFTLRFIPAREDLSTPAAWSSPTSTRAAVEVMPSGCIAVVGAEGCQDAGIFGDILCQRMASRDVAGLVTDGVIRDKVGIIDTGLPVWASGVAAPPAVAGLTFVNWQEPVGCGGVAIFPDDLIVADQDGAIVIPQAMVDDVAAEATEMEALEEWVIQEIRSGKALPGLYPPNDEAKARYAAQKQGK